MPRCVLLLGGECTGKSALAEALAAATDGTVIPEFVRRFVDSRGRTPRHAEQEEILRAQNFELHEGMGLGATSHLVISDPAPLMTAVYSIQYFNDSSLLDVGFDLAAPLHAVWVWCYPDIPWVADGLHRDGPDARAATHELIADTVIPRLGKQLLIHARGSTVERAEKVLAALNS